MTGVTAIPIAMFPPPFLGAGSWSGSFGQLGAAARSRGAMNSVSAIFFRASGIAV